MSTDIGPGDVVEAVEDVSDGGALVYPRGCRCVVRWVDPPWMFDACPQCGAEAAGLVFVDDLLGPRAAEAWCICGFRKIGGSREDTAALFRETLNVRAPGLERV